MKAIKSLILSVLFAASVGCIADEAVPNQVAKPMVRTSEFVKYKKFNNWTMFVQPSSVRPDVDKDGDTFIILNVRMILDQPTKFVDSPKPLKKFEGEFIVFCPAKTIGSLNTRMFDENGHQIGSTNDLRQYENTGEANTPAHEIVRLVCPVLYNLHRKQAPNSTPYSRGLIL